MNTIVAESLDEMATQLEAELGPDQSPDEFVAAVRKVLKSVIQEHKQIIFDGDNYSAEWHAEAARRGLPNLKDSVEAVPMISSDKATALFSKYKVMQPAEIESRLYAYMEKYAKQLLIESESMVLMARQMILPAALLHQTRLANAISSTSDAGVECKDQVVTLTEFVDLVYRFNSTLEALAQADNYEDEDPIEMARFMKQNVMPLMDSLRELADDLETRIAADLWPLPSYREMLFIK